jgi:hypothetical protein
LLHSLPYSMRPKVPPPHCQTSRRSRHTSWRVSGARCRELPHESRQILRLLNRISRPLLGSFGTLSPHHCKWRRGDLQLLPSEVLVLFPL